MRVIKWVLSLILLVVVIAAVAGYIFLRNFDLNKYKDYAADLVYQQTGRKLVVNGNAELGISLIPTLVINDVSLSNPVWAKNPEMLKLKSLELQLSILPLLRKELVLDKAILQQPQIYLETSADGKTSWDFAAPQQPQKQAFYRSGWLIATANAAETKNVQSGKLPGGISNIIARKVEVNGGEISFYDGKSRQSHLVKIKNVDLSTEGFSQPVAVNWDIVYNDMAFAGNGTLGALQHLLNNLPDYPVNLQVSALGLTADADVLLSDIADNLKAKFDLRVKNPAGNLNAPAVSLDASGTADMQNVALNIGKLDVAGNIITGKATVSLARKLPYVTADLQSGLISVPSLLPAKKTAFRWPELIASAHASQLVPNDTIPFAFLNMANAKANLSVKKIIVNEALSVSDVKLAAALNDGILRINPLDMKLGNGTVNLTADVNAAQKSVALKLNGKDIVLQEMYRDLAASSNGNFGFLSGGQTMLFADLSGKGATYRQLADSLDGQLIAIVGKSEVQTGKLRFATNNFISQLLSVLKIDTSKVNKADLKCAVVRSDFKGGKVVLPKGIAVDSNRLTLVSDGKINLVNDSLSLTLNAYQNGAADLGIMQALSSLVKIGGTLQSPKITLDTGGAVKTIAGVVAGGPAALGANMLLDRDSAPCYTALKDTAYADMFPKPSGVSGTAQNTYQGASKAVKDSVKDLKNNAKKLLNILK